MALGRRGGGRQEELWIAAAALPGRLGIPYTCEKLNQPPAKAEIVL